MVVPALQGIEAVFHYQTGAVLPFLPLFGESPNGQQGEKQDKKRYVSFQGLFLTEKGEWRNGFGVGAGLAPALQQIRLTMKKKGNRKGYPYTKNKENILFFTRKVRY